MTTEPLFLTLPETAKLINMGASFLRKQISNGSLLEKIHYVRIGRSIRFLPEMIILWVKEPADIHAKTITAYLKSLTTKN